MTYVDLANAIQARIVSMWPERTFYRDFCPSDFDRPSCFLAVTSAAPASANAALIQWEFLAVLTLFCSTGEYDVQSAEELICDQQRVLARFGPGYIEVGDRSVSLEATGEAPEAGEAFVTFRSAWLAPRTGVAVQEFPLMDQFEQRVDQKNANRKEL